MKCLPLGLCVVSVREKGRVCIEALDSDWWGSDAPARPDCGNVSSEARV